MIAMVCFDLSFPAAEDPLADRYHFNWIFVKRFCKVLRIIFPQWKSCAVILFVLLLCLVLLEQYVIFQVGMIPSKYFGILGEKNLESFKTHTIVAVLIILAMAFIRASKKYVCAVFGVCARGLLTHYLHSGYFKEIIFYRLNVLSTVIDNADQRITQDVEKMCRTFSEIIADLLISPFTIAYYTYYTWSSTGYIGPLCVFAFFAVSTTLNKFLMSPVVSLVYSQEQLEGDFRFKHMQIRSNSESAAFYRCGQVELAKTNEKLDHLLKVQQQLNLAQYVLEFSVNIADYLGSILSYIILAIPIFAGAHDDLTPSQLSALISKNAFVTIYLISCFTRLIDMALKMSDIAGTTHRIVQLDESMRDLLKSDLFGSDSNLLNSGVLSSDFPSVAYSVDSLSYSTPVAASQLLVSNLSMQMKKGVNILVTGDSGCGKSSLLRVLDGLWLRTKGVILRNVLHGFQGVMYLPQKPYLTDGCLRDQIIFPYRNPHIHAVDDDQLVGLLKDVGLGDLHKRTGGLDCSLHWNWYDVLSPGEMQRLSFVRLFYHQPRFAVLDEATSQVTFEMEQLLYSICAKMDITLLSVGHRLSLRQYHHVELKMKGNGDWKLEDISDT